MVPDCRRHRTCCLHFLPSFHTLNTEEGRRIQERFGLQEVRSPTRCSSPTRRSVTQAENRMLTIKPVLVATLACGRRRRQGDETGRRPRRRCANIPVAADQLAKVAESNDLIVTHGNGPQIGLLALQAAAGDAVKAFSLDTLGAGTDGMIGYLLAQKLANRLPPDRAVARCGQAVAHTYSWNSRLLIGVGVFAFTIYLHDLRKIAQQSAVSAPTHRPPKLAGTN